MDKQAIPLPLLALQPFTTFDPEGILLVCGTGADHANPMTISWGTFGIMWGRPIVMVMVRPTRHTWNFINQASDFTVNWMHEEWTDALRLCGSVSGRDTHKFDATGLTPVSADRVTSPIIDESMLALECRIVYRDAVDPDKCLDPTILDNYPARDYHGLFYGEVVAASGIDRFRCG